MLYWGKGYNNHCNKASNNSTNFVAGGWMKDEHFDDEFHVSYVLHKLVLLAWYK